MKLIHSATSVAVIALLLAGCGQREIILEGERIAVADTRTGSGGAPADPTGLQTEEGASDVVVADEVGNRALPIDLPAPQNHAAWTHRNGTATHRIIHPQLGTELAHVWSANIGSGDGRRHRITADPVVSQGVIYTMDSRATVMAHSSDGARIWSRDLTPGFARSDEASGGGLAIEGDVLVATTGFGTIVAMNAASGEEIWLQRLDAPATGAPTVVGDLVYAVSRDSRAWAVDIEDGRVRWQLPGTPTPSVMVGGAGPAVSERVALFPFGSGDVVASFPRGGVQLWASAVAGQRRGRVYANVTDITGDPVIDGEVVYIGNSSGRIAALSARSGERIWTATEGTLSPVWPAGGSVFLVSDQAELLRLDAATGERIWGVTLPYFRNERVRRREDVFTHYGPVLAGGRLIVGSNDGQLRSFDPVDGTLLSSVSVPGGATTLPAIVDGTLYVVSANGQLHAFR